MLHVLNDPALSKAQNNVNSEKSDCKNKIVDTERPHFYTAWVNEGFQNGSFVMAENKSTKESDGVGFQMDVS